MASGYDSMRNYMKQKVFQWLEEVFEGEVPRFEESDEVISALVQLMEKNRTAERRTTRIIEAEENLTHSYKRSKDDLSDILKEISLSPEAMEKVNQIASLATRMRLKKPTLSNFIMALMEAENNRIRKKEKDRECEYTISRLSKLITHVMEQNETLQSNCNLKKSEVNGAAELSEQTTFLKRKGAEYKYQINKSEKHLESIGCDPELFHSNLVEKAEEVEDLRRKVEALNAKLESYCSLPPNEDLAQLKIQETQAELTDLEEKFQTLLEGATSPLL